MGGKRKRSGPGLDRDRPNQSQRTRYNQVYRIPSRSIAGQGIFVTCVMGKERKAAAQLIDRLEELADEVYPGVVPEVPAAAPVEAEGEDEEELMDRMRNGAPPPPPKAPEPEAKAELGLEDEIAAELAALKGRNKDNGKPGTAAARFKKIETDTECFVFISVAKPLCPYTLVRKLLEDVERTGEPHSRFVLRLSPVSDTAPANADAVRELAQKVLPPFFADGPKKFKIDPRIRSHSTLKRDQLIATVAAAVPTADPPHTADLTNPDYWIIVEVHKNVCAIGVVEHFERFKKMNVQSVAEAVNKQRAELEGEGRVKDSLKS